MVAKNTVARTMGNKDIILQTVMISRIETIIAMSKAFMV